MKNQYDFSPSNVPAEVLKQRFMEEKVKVIDAMKSFPDVKIGTDYKLSGSKNDIEKVLSKLEKDLPNNPHVAKLMAMNTYQTITDPKLGSVHQVTVYGQKILLQINDDNNPDKIGNSNAQVWLNTANAIKESGLKTISINHVNYDPGGSGTHGKGTAVDIGYVIDQSGKAYSAVADKNANISRDQSYPDAIRALDNAFIRQNGSGNIWNPWQMYDGNGTPAYENRLWQWKNSPEWDKFKGLMEGSKTKENADEIIKLHNKLGLKPPMALNYDVFRQDIGHLDHLHYNINTDKSLKEFTQWKKL